MAHARSTINLYSVDKRTTGMLLLNLLNVQQTILLLIPETNIDVSTNLAKPVLPNADDYRPVVIWHGLGDNYNSSGIHKVHEILDSMYPGIYVHSIRLDENPSSDEQKSFFGDANRQIDEVCKQLRNITELLKGFDSIGFSQGGVFLRGLIERCPLEVNNFITFGSPHLGVLELPLCKDRFDWLCKQRNALLKKQVWRDSVQKRVVPAQYFRDPAHLDQYLEHSNYLADINNERAERNATYKKNFSKLNKLVLVSFTEDTTLVPKESSQFYDFDPEQKRSIPFLYTELYKNDYIGLKALYKKNSVDFLSIKAEHMHIDEGFIKSIAQEYFGGKLGT